ncbi:MAG: EAL domain-containing protein [Gammaproteobacteria bacterium]|nr:EAL domain-containing protein [Gammaproteobacteria bacterium]
MEQDNLPFQPKLPSRIAGIVFWVLVLISLIVAVYFLNKAENEIDISRKSNVYLLGHELEETIKLAVQDMRDISQAKDALDQKISHYQAIMGFSSVQFIGYEQGLKFGHPNSDDDEIIHKIAHYSDNAVTDTISIKVYFKNKQKTVAEIRKNMLLGIGIGILVIGFFLRYVLHIMLTRPFVNMLESAKGFTLGDESIRFNESRQDEFGYLGRFINHALESILSHQEDLVEALERASKSEVALSVEKETAEVTLRSITDSVVTVDQQSIVTFLNPAAEKLLQCTLKESVGMPFSEVLNIVDEFSEFLDIDPVNECFEKGDIVDFPEQSSLLSKKSSLIAVEASAAPMKNEQGDLLGAVIVIQDVSHTRKLTRQLSYQASHDALTGLYNRRKFESHLKEALINAKHEDRHHVLLYLDLDQFKIVNDTCGHVAGDELLQQLPLIFNKVLRSGDLIARLGGDEFGVLLENCSLDKSIVIADKIRQHIKEFRFVWGEKTFEIGASIGVVAIDLEHTDMNYILSSADIACYAAKDAGRNRVHVYEESDEIVSRRHGEMHWTARITQAIEENRFVLYKQNIVNIKTGVLEHVEVLVRMIGEDSSIILPGAFMPAAERYNLMATIDRWVISHVFQLMGASATKGSDGPLNIAAINLSGDSLSDDGLLEFIYAEKDKYNVSLDKVCFEITETVAISNLSQAVAFIDELKQHGCKFALDDFGSGLSSFAYLKSLPVHYLKIDGSFVRDISKDEIDKAMVKSIQQVAEAMDLMTIAEWVENEHTFNLLKDLGVDCAQGNYLMAAQPIVCES